MCAKSPYQLHEGVDSYIVGRKRLFGDQRIFFPLYDYVTTNYAKHPSGTRQRIFAKPFANNIMAEMISASKQVLSTMPPKTKNPKASLGSLNASVAPGIWAPPNNKLPSEMLVNIFKYLVNASVRLSLDILTVSIVCTDWQAAAELVLNQNTFNDPLAEMPLDYVKGFVSVLRQCAKQGVDYGCRVQYITVNLTQCYLPNCYSNCRDSENYNFGSYYFENCWNTEAKDLYIAVSQLCYNARGIRFSGAGEALKREENYLEMSSIDPRLLQGNLVTELEGESLTLRQVDGIIKNNNLKSLQKVILSERTVYHKKNSIPYEKKEPDVFLKKLANEAKNLRHLELRQFATITGKGITVEDIRWPQLQYLILPKNKQMSWEFVRAVVMACPKLYMVHCPCPVTNNVRKRNFAECKNVEIFLQEHGFQLCDKTDRKIWYNYQNCKEERM